MPFAALQDVTLHYELDGPRDAPILLFSNSLGTNLKMWDGQAAAFATDFRVLRYDTRGHGTSTTPDGPYTLSDLGKDVIGLMDELAIEKANFCGLSLGGMTALWLGIHAPHRFNRLIAANTAARIGTAESWNARIEQVKQQGMQSIADALLARWYTHAFLHTHPAEIAATRAMLLNTSPDGYTACCAAIRDIDQTGEVSSIELPALIVSGSHDPVTPAADGRFLEQHLPAAQYLELNAAHLSNIEDAASFNLGVLQFLSSRE